MIRFFSIPLVKSILLAIILNTITQLYDFSKIPKWEFIGPYKIAPISELEIFNPSTFNLDIYIIEILNKAEFSDNIKFNIEFYKKFPFRLMAFKFDSSRKRSELRISYQDKHFVSWESIKSPDRNDMNIALHPLEKIEILIFNEIKSKGIPIKNITILHSRDRIFTFKEYESRMKSREFIFIIGIVFLFLILPIALILTKIERGFLRKCDLQNKKAIIKFMDRHYENIYKEIKKFNIGKNNQEIDQFTSIIMKEYIFLKWKTLPKYYRGLSKSIEKEARNWCIFYKMPDLMKKIQVKENE